MNFLHRLALAFLSLGLLCACGPRDPSTLVRGGYDEREMEAAIERARLEIPDFLSALAQNHGTDFSVKVPIEDGEHTEHFWLTNVSYSEGVFTGKIGNDPGLVSNVKYGQAWTVKASEISDWMFFRDDKIHGNHTLRPLLKTMPKEEADMWRSLLAVP